MIRNRPHGRASKKQVYSFAFSAFRDGRIPLWSPQIFLGFPQYAEPQFSTFYLPMWLLAGLGVAQAISWLYALHFGLTAVGGYLLARHLGDAAYVGNLTVLPVTAVPEQYPKNLNVAGQRQFDDVVRLPACIRVENE